MHKRARESDHVSWCGGMVSLIHREINVLMGTRSDQSVSELNRRDILLTPLLNGGDAAIAAACENRCISVLFYSAIASKHAERLTDSC